MIIVEIGKNENLERALKTLKSKVIKTKQQKMIKFPKMIKSWQAILLCFN